MHLIGTQQKIIIEYRKIECVYFDKTAATVGPLWPQIYIMHFGDVIYGIKFRLGHGSITLYFYITHCIAYKSQIIGSHLTQILIK